MTSTNTNQSIEIDASAANVWKVLTDPEFSKVWFKEFTWGGEMETDFKLGSSIYFRDESGQGLKALITVCEPNKEFTYKYESSFSDTNGTPDDDETIKWQGLTEGYKLEEKDGKTILTLDSNYPSEYQEDFEGNWDAPLQAIKGLSETLKDLEKEGFSDLSMCNFGPGFDSGEHTHDEHTVHVIVEGELTIEDQDGVHNFEAGDMVEFEPGTKHVAKSGKDNFAMIVGTKNNL